MSTLLSLADCLKAGRYTLYRSLTDAGVATDRAILALDVLLGPEPEDDQADDDTFGEPLEWHPEPPAEFEPGPEDWEEAALIFDRMDLPPWPVEYPAVFTEADARAAGLAVG